MVQLQWLTGKQAGTRWVARRFPVRIGRSPACDLQLEESGVWDDHAELTLDPVNGVMLAARPDALVTVNREPVQTTRLRNGDSVEIASVRLQFWLAETRQRGLRVREWFVWSLVAVISLGEIALIYWLLK
jgi:pSer/pThr/pTyr-binding forkhead associated (FHA) protein